MKSGQAKYRLLIENLPDAFAYHQIITDVASKPVDYIFLEVNTAFEGMTGLARGKIIGEKVTHILPGISDSGFDWIGTYGKVALTGESIRFEQYSEPLERWYAITAYSDEPGFFAVIFRDVTEYKNSEEAFKLNSGLITSLVDSMPDLFFYKDLDGVYLGCNTEFTLHVGYEKEDIVGKTDYDLYSKEEADAYRENNRHMLELGTKRHNEEWISYPNGRKVLLDTLKTPYYNSDGKQIGILGISRDITERKKAEEALHVSEERYRILVENVSVAIVVAQDKMHKYVNAMAVQLFGCSEEVLLALPISQFIHPEDRDMVIDRHSKRLRAQQVTAGYIHRIISGNGQTKWVESNNVLIQWEGQPASLTFLMDITERKQAEEALQESERKFRAVFEGSHDAITVVTKEGKLVDCNQRALVIYGLSNKEEFMAARPADFSPPVQPDGRNSRHASRQYIKEAITKGEPMRFEWLHQRKDGNTFPAEIILTLYKTGEEIALQATVRDITERKEAEKQIQENNLILAWLNTIALEQAGVLSYERLIELILEQIKESTGAIISVFNEYDAEKKVLISRKVKSEKNIINIAVRLGGKKILNTVTPVDDAVHNRILSFVVNYHATLTQASEGTIPATVSAAIQKLSGVQRFIALSHVTEGKLYGTTLIGLGKGQADASLEFLESFAHITAISLRRLQAEQQLADYTLELEQLYHQLDAELDKARQVHERILPKSLPTLEGISFAAHYQPAQTLGGDFYDVIHTCNKLVFYLSDVSGHGLDGAMLSVFIKQAIDSYVNLKPDDISPHKILQHLSRQFSRENYPEDLYFCIFMAVLDLDTLELSYCGAGFQQELLLRLGSSEALQLATKGMFITSYLPAEMLTLQDESVHITPGTTIFLTSDGLTEQGSKGAYYRDRLPGVFYENAHLPATLVAQAVVDDFRIFNNGSLQGKDDITFLVLKVKGE